MTTHSTDTLWRKYDALTRSTTATPQQRHAAFNAWWKLEKADAFQSYTNEQRDLKRKQGKAAHA